MAIATRTAPETTTQPPLLHPDNSDREKVGRNRALDPEAALRTAAAAGDRAAFAALYATYQESIFRYLVRRCRGDRHLAEDLTQDTFARALRSLPQYRETGRPFSAWLLTIACNLLTDYWRSGWHRYQIPWNDFTGDGNDGWLIVSSDSGGDPAVAVAASDRHRHLARAIGRLTNRQQQVLDLRYAQGLSVADTARALGLDQGAVKAATYRARQALADDPIVGALR